MGGAPRDPSSACVVAGVGRIAGAVVAGVMFSAAGLFVTFLNLRLNIGGYQAIVAGLALVLTAVQHPDGITGTGHRQGPRRRPGQRPGPRGGRVPQTAQRTGGGEPADRSKSKTLIFPNGPV